MEVFTKPFERTRQDWMNQAAVALSVMKQGHYRTLGEYRKHDELNYGSLMEALKELDVPMMHLGEYERQSPVG